jgi:hydroxyacylglutathione hydrolase
MKLTDNLFAYIWKGNDNNCNTYVFTNILEDNKHIIFDPGHISTPFLHEPGYEMLMKQLNKDGLKIEDIKMIILSHGHGDHIESANKLSENNRAKIAIHKDDELEYKLSGGKKIDLFLEEGELKLVPPTREKLEVIHTPGHSPGAISVYWPSHKALVVGDVVFYRNIGRYDLPGGDPNKLKNSIEKLAKLDVEYLLCGHPYGHPGVIQGKEAIKQNFDFILNNIFG